MVRVRLGEEGAPTTGDQLLLLPFALCSHRYENGPVPPAVTESVTFDPEQTGVVAANGVTVVIGFTTMVTDPEIVVLHAGAV